MADLEGRNKKGRDNLRPEFGWLRPQFYTLVSA